MKGNEKAKRNGEDYNQNKWPKGRAPPQEEREEANPPEKEKISEKRWRKQKEDIGGAQQSVHQKKTYKIKINLGISATRVIHQQSKTVEIPKLTAD